MRFREISETREVERRFEDCQLGKAAAFYEDSERPEEGYELPLVKMLHDQARRNAI